MSDEQPKININIDKYNFFSPMIAASLTNAIITHLYANKIDKSIEKDDLIHSTDVVMSLWGDICEAIEKVSQKKGDDQTSEK